jgi:copper(I)-binding protein
MNKDKIIMSLIGGAVAMAALAGGYLLIDASPRKPAPATNLAELYKDEPLKVDYVYAFATAPDAKTGAVFLIVYNQADTQDFLIKAETKVAEITELHQNYIDPDDQTMMMRKVDKIEIPENYDVMLMPQGHHVMLINLFRGLNTGDTFDIDLTFEKAGKITVPVKVVPPGQPLEPTDYDVFDPDEGMEKEGHHHVEEAPPANVPPVWVGGDAP